LHPKESPHHKEEPKKEHHSPKHEEKHDVDLHIDCKHTLDEKQKEIEDLIEEL
jgi:hypothetical protein